MSCRACGSRGPLPEFMDFGYLPLGNAFLTHDQTNDEKSYRLALGFCGTCYMVQQLAPPPTSDLHSDYSNYSYVPFGTTLDRHYSELAHSLVNDLKLGRTSAVLDVGSNDGKLLNYLRREAGCKILGVEPAVRISEMARDAGVPTVTGFFDRQTAEKAMKIHGRFDVVVLTQVLQHIPDLKQLIADVGHVLKPGGTIVVEGRYFADTLAKTSYDTVYHEMLWFFTLHSLVELFARHGFWVVHAQKVDVYGGSLRVYVQGGRVSADDSVRRIMREEAMAGLTQVAPYIQFAERARKLRDELHFKVMELTAKGKKVAAYGAPSTGTTLMNFAHLGGEEAPVEYIVDDSPLKQNKLQPGTHVPILPFEELAEDPPDYCLILAWRLAPEILAKLEKQRAAGMKCILPLPQVEVL